MSIDDALGTAAEPRGWAGGAWAVGVPTWQSVSLRARRAIVATAIGVVAVVCRTRGLHESFWVDDGIATGIASHALTAIPHALQQDGSPPLYYVLLHWWMQLFGGSDVAAYALSVLFALLCVPAALWAGWSLFGERTGWACAALAAVTPYLTQYAGQARMYTLLVLLSLIVAATFAGAFVNRDRRQLPWFALALAAALYTHLWAMFLGLGAAVAMIPCLWAAPVGPARRALLRDGVLAFGAAGLAFVPWLPTLLEQVHSTGAPWSLAPSRADLFRMPHFVLGVALIGPATLAAAAGWAGDVRRGRARDLFCALVLLLMVAVLLVVGWKTARVTSSWATRYVAVAVGPALLVLAGGLVRAGRLGVLAAIVSVPFWLPPWHIPEADKSNVRANLGTIGGPLNRGDLVVATQPELVPVLRHYLGPAPGYASTLGPTADPRVMDWRHALARMRATHVDSFEASLRRVPLGGRVVLVRPKGPPPAGIPWQQLGHIRARQWLRALRADRGFRVGPTHQRGYGRARLAPVAVVVARRVRDA